MEGGGGEIAKEKGKLKQADAETDKEPLQVAATIEFIDASEVNQNQDQS